MAEGNKGTHLYQQLEALPENMVGEIVGGELYASPRPRPLHAVAESGVLGELHGPFARGRGGPGGWWILTEPELHLGPDVMVPDVAGWRRERMPHVPEGTVFTLAPDWICEVLSPSTAKLDVEKKMPRYNAAGVQHAWIVDPTNRLLQIFRAEKDGWRLLPTASSSGKIRAEPFEAIELELSAIFPDPAKR